MKRISLIVLFVLLSVSVYAAEIVRIAPLTIEIKSTMTTITGTAAKVPSVALVGRENIALYNVTNSTETVWCGASDVTSSNGWPLTSSAPAISMDLNDSISVWCVSGGASTDVRSLETK